MMTVEHLFGAWNGFFFEPVPVYPLALFRIVFGCLLLVDSFFLLGNLRDYLGPHGLIEYRRYFKRSRHLVFSLFLYFPPTMASVYWIMGLHLVSVTMMTVGFLTPLSTLLSFITLRSIVNRNPQICNGGENVAKIMCFFLIFAPSGSAWSLDAVLFHAKDLHVLHAPWALRLMQLQVSIIYLYTAYWKLKGETYRNGTALYYAASNFVYSRLAFPRFLLRKPWVQWLTWGTLAFEFALGSGLWIEEFRHWLVAMGVGFHLAIECILSVHLFGWYMIASLLLFLDPAWLERML